MEKQEFKFRSTGDTCDIRAVKYVPKKKIKAVLQIAHGMVEFIDRYDDFARFLSDNGYLVVGNDHIGHGESVNSYDDWGYFCENDGNKVLLDDIYKLTTIIKEEYKDVPYFLLGHSMGSFYARQYLFEYGKQIDGAIIMGTGYEPLITLKAGMLICKVIAMFKGWKYRSSLVNDMAFGSYNKRFEPIRTKADWLSKDEELVDWYINEPKCSFMFTLNGYYNMFKGISRLHDKSLLEKTPKDIPLLFVSGEDDPVGQFTKAVKESVKSLKDVGCNNIDMIFYPNDRHEILNETDKEVVYKDILDWLNKK